MSGEAAELLARARAHVAGRAVLFRVTSPLADLGSPDFGIALLIIPSGRRLQAVACGELPGQPQIAVAEEPTDLGLTWLVGVAEVTDRYLLSCLERGRLPRIWLPHGAALDALDLFARRAEADASAAAPVRRFAGQCRALIEETHYAGQQAIVPATRLLLETLRTGQQPADDGHLGALLVPY